MLQFLIYNFIFNFHIGTTPRPLVPGHRGTRPLAPGDRGARPLALPRRGTRPLALLECRGARPLALPRRRFTGGFPGARPLALPRRGAGGFPGTRPLLVPGEPRVLGGLGGPAYLLRTRLNNIE